MSKRFCTFFFNIFIFLKVKLIYTSFSFHVCFFTFRFHKILHNVSKVIFITLTQVHYLQL